MTAALALARRGLGRVSPNPAVGCVLVRDGRVVGRGWTQPGGRPHAEAEALARAGDAAKGATAYVTLEPCAHHGETPPCAEALAAAGIARCVVGCGDPDERVDGQGAAKLRAAGVQVENGLLEAACRDLNAGFLGLRRHGRPLVCLKLATSLDGRIATAGGESQWITGAEARARAHLLRAQHDAVLVGSGTALADDPRLDVRLPGLAGCRPWRVVVDARLRLPLGHDLVLRAAEQPTLVVTRPGHPTAKLALYRAAGVEIVTVEPDGGGRLPPAAWLQALGRRGLTRVLVEGGAAVAAALVEADLVDRLAWFRAASLLGGDGRPGLFGFGLRHLAEAPRFRRIGVETLGEDLLETFRRDA